MQADLKLRWMYMFEGRVSDVVAHSNNNEQFVYKVM